MKIVVLDGCTLNPGDLSWDGLNPLGDVALYDRTPKSQTVERSAGSEILLTNKVILDAETIAKLPDLRYIGVTATGYNVVDVEAARRRRILVTNVPKYATNSVAQYVFALLLELCQHIQAHSDAVRKGDWSRSTDFCFWNFPLIELAGKTMGIIGFGQIGRQVARIAATMGMRILAADVVKTDPPTDIAHFQWAEIDDLLKECDVVSLHCPLSGDNEGLINRKRLGLMKPSAFLINTARGPLVVDADLAWALNNDRIAGAGLDVLSVEPPPSTNPLLKAKNCLITPHIAWATKESRKRLLDASVENVRAFLAGQPTNVVNPW